uniref:hypothetical protein n=1 Tax=Microbulbifer agarilyticus TaxID=260552 RepID=UPI0002558E31|nr:hypothetical protein [Microbulbifer agarilyticus]
MTIEEIIKKTLKNGLSYKDLEGFSTQEGTSVEDSFNRVSLYIARKFDVGEMSYEDGDYAMNEVWNIMLDYIVNQDIPIIQPCYDIYCAFDAGEYIHKDETDPVAEYTRPSIKAVLKNA